MAWGLTLGYLGNVLGEIVAKQHTTSIASLKTDSSISKVRPLCVRNNFDGPHLHEKPLKVIIRDPLKKPINSRKLKEKGLDNERVRN